MKNKEIKMSFNAPLNERDSETQTVGCRQSNPDICGNNGIVGICAFATVDGVCRKPSRAWKKKYKELKGQ